MSTVMYEVVVYDLCCFLFKQKTAYEMRISDWSSDVCSSDRGAGSYRLIAEAETQGFLGWLTAWKGTTESRGRIAGGKVVPGHHLNWGTDDDSEEGARLAEISYDRRGEVIGTLVQPAPAWGGPNPRPRDAGQGPLAPPAVLAGLGGLV